MTRRFPAVLCVAALCAGLARADAQPVPQLLAEARRQIDDLNSDSAAALLGRVLNDGRTSDVQRLRGFTLMAIAELSRGNRVAARQALEWTLRIDATARVDSLAFLHSDLMLLFGEARTALGIRDAAPAAARLTVSLDVPRDTVVPVGGRVRLLVQPSARARVVLTAAPADNPGSILWADTAAQTGASLRDWPVRGIAGAALPDGRYAVRATATDSTGVVSETLERIVVVGRLPVDTQPLPIAPTLEPESLRLRRGSPGVLAWGAALGALVLAAPMLLGNPDVNDGAGSDPAAVAVAGGVTLAGVLGWLGGGRVRALPDNIARNQRAQADYLRLRDAAIAANREARARADVRVRFEGATP